MLKFYALGLSGYCTKVRIVLRIKGIEFEELTPDGGHYSTPEYQMRMPPGSIPAIEDEGFKLFDSEAIVEYLEDNWPTPSMRASEIKQRAKQRALAQFHNTRLEPTVRALFPLVKQAAAEIKADALESARSAFHQQLEKLVMVVDPAPFVGGDHPCLADCGFPATIRMGQGLFDALGSEVVLPEKITTWMEALEGHVIIGEELTANRVAVAGWIGQFR